MRSLTGVIGGTCAVLFALAAATACSSDKPSTVPPLTTTPAPLSSDPSTPPPATSSAPTGTQEQQVKAAVVAFYAAVTKAYQTANPDLIKPLSAPGCKGCANFEASVAAMKARGQHATGAAYRIEAPSAQAAGPRAASVACTLRFLGAAFVTTSGATAQIFPASSQREQIDLDLVRGVWRVREIVGLK